MSTGRTCGVNGCSRPLCAKGYCRRHYDRVHNHRYNKQICQIIAIAEIRAEAKEDSESLFADDTYKNFIDVECDV